MKIPIQNIYFLLCYAWDKLEESKIVDVDAIESTSLVDLFARVLISGANHLLKRGIDRGYVPQHEWGSRLRGRICFQEALRKSGMRAASLPCDFDELSHDVLPNRILKSTIFRLMHVDGLDSECAEGLSKICRMLSDLRDVELSSRVFGRVQLHRNNQFYDFLLKVCELIYRNLLVSEKSGKTKFRDFVRDRRQMESLFEAFVRNFYRLHSKFTVKREDIRWNWVPADLASRELLPKMQTDVSLTSHARKIIIECKFTPNATQHHFDAKKLRSYHLFQIHAYMDNLREKFADTCEMILLYPSMGIEKAVSASYRDGGHKISVRMINLSQPWQSIHKDLLALIE
ncbi:MAG: hypothetical protein ABSB42_07570 [Tepidisphaeraceae bacterium]